MCMRVCVCVCDKNSQTESLIKSLLNVNEVMCTAEN